MALLALALWVELLEAVCFWYVVVFGNRGNVVGFCNVGSNGNIMNAW